jgi:hypothetical protein
LELNLPDELRHYIEKVHREPYLPDTCIGKNLKVARKAQALGLTSELVICLAQTPKWMRWIYPYNPHTYLIIDGVKVDLFYARWWRTERVVKCSRRIWTFKGRR